MERQRDVGRHRLLAQASQNSIETPAFRRQGSVAKHRDQIRARHRCALLRLGNMLHEKQLAAGQSYGSAGGRNKEPSTEIQPPTQAAFGALKPERLRRPR